MVQLTGARVDVSLPTGWEGEIDDGSLQTVADGSVRTATVHLANFPLPPQRGDFASGAVERMRAGDILMVLFEYDGGSARTALFEARSLPRVVAAGDFDPSALQWGRPGMSGLQRFFTENGRPFCLYIVVGSHIDRHDVLDEINHVLGAVEIAR